MWWFWNPRQNVSKFDSLALPIPITLVSEQTFDERQLFNLVAAISAYTTIQKGTRARICSVMQSPWNPKMRRGCSVDSADMWQRVCTDGKKITGWGLVRRLGDNCNHHTIGGRVEDLVIYTSKQLHVCARRTLLEREKKSWGWLQGLGWLVGIVHRYGECTNCTKIYQNIQINLWKKSFSCFRKLLHVYPLLPSSLFQ